MLQLLLQEHLCCLQVLPLQEEEVEQGGLSCEAAWMDPGPDRDELVLLEEDPRTSRTRTKTSPSAVHPSLSCGQNRNLTLCSEPKNFEVRTQLTENQFNLESDQKLSKVIIKFSSLLKISFQLHKCIISLK